MTFDEVRRKYPLAVEWVSNTLRADSPQNWHIFHCCGKHAFPELRKLQARFARRDRRSGRGNR